MIIFKQKDYSFFKKYKELSDEDISNMTRGEKLNAIDEERKTAEENAEKIKKIYREGLGIGGGATLGYLGNKGARYSGVDPSFPTAASIYIGYTQGKNLGDVIGTKRANKKGHNPEKRSSDLAKRIDEIAKKHGQIDDYSHETEKINALKR